MNAIEFQTTVHDGILEIPLVHEFDSASPFSRRHTDQTWGWVDAAPLVVMHRMGLRTALADLDHNSDHPSAREVAGPHSGPYGRGAVGSAVRTKDLAVG